MVERKLGYKHPDFERGCAFKLKDKELCVQLVRVAPLVQCSLCPIFYYEVVEVRCRARGAAIAGIFYSLQCSLILRDQDGATSMAPANLPNCHTSTISQKIGD